MQECELNGKLFIIIIIIIITVIILKVRPQQPRNGTFSHFLCGNGPQIW